MMKLWAGRIIVKVLNVLYQFRNLGPVLNENALVTVYYSNCEYHLRFIVLLWGLSTNLKDIRALKIILRSLLLLNYHESGEENFWKLEVLTLLRRFVFELRIFWVIIYIFCNLQYDQKIDQKLWVHLRF